MTRLRWDEGRRQGKGSSFSEERESWGETGQRGHHAFVLGMQAKRGPALGWTNQSVTAEVAH